MIRLNGTTLEEQLVLINEKLVNEKLMISVFEDRRLDAPSNL